MITGECLLPRGGNPENGIPTTLIMRGAKVSEWKSLISTSSTKYKYVVLWNLCDQTPGWQAGIDIAKFLFPIDITKMFMVARMLTISPDLKVRVTCPECGFQELYTIALDKVEFTPFDGVNEGFVDFKYPDRKDKNLMVDHKILVKAFTEDEIESVRDAAKKLNESRRAAIKGFDIDWIETLAEIVPLYAIRKIDDQVMSYDFIQTFYPDLDMTTYNQVETLSYELQYKVAAKPFMRVCGNCGASQETEVPQSRQFLYY